MGERGARNEPATPDDIEAMARIVREGIEAGAPRRLDVAHDRPPRHRRRAGARARSPPRTSCSASAARSPTPAPACSSSRPPGVLGEDLAAPEREMDWMRRLAARDGPAGDVRAARSTTSIPTSGSKMLDLAAEALRRGRADPPAGRGPPARAAARAPDVPPAARPAELRAARRAAARRAGRGDARPRRCAARSCSRSAPTQDDRMAFIGLGLDRIFLLGEPPDYEPAPDAEHRRARASVTVATRRTSSTTCCSRTTAASCCCARCSATATSPRTRSARCCCTRRARSGSATAARTSARSATRASRPTCSRTGCATAPAASACPLELVVRKMTSDTASLYGLGRPRRARAGQAGRRQRHRPRRARAAPARDGLRPARRRAAPDADAPTATTPRSSRGEVVMRDGVDTGARPGRLVRGR